MYSREGLIPGFSRSARVTAGLCTLLGAILLMAWIEGAFDLAARASVPHFDLALALLLAGAAAWATSRRRLLIAAIFMLLPVLLALATIANYVLGLPLLVLPFGPEQRGSLPMVSALGLLLAALGLCCYRRPLLMGLAGVATGAIGLTSLMAALFGSDQQSLLLGPGLLTVECGAGFVLLGASVFAQAAAWGWHGPSASARWILLPLAVAGITVVISLWQALRVQQELVLQQAMQEESGAVADGFQARARPHIQALIRMGSRWQRRGGMPRDEWLTDAELLALHQPAYQAIGWADNDGIVRWVVPEHAADAALNSSLADDPRRRAALEQARASGGPVVSQRVELEAGGDGFLIVMPVYAGERNDGFLVGALRLAPLIEGVLSKLSAANAVSAVGLQVLEGDEVLFEQARDQPHSSRLLVERPLTFGNRTWQLRIWATPEFVAERHSPLPTAVLVMGLVLTGLLLLVMRFWLDARARAVELGREVLERQRVEQALGRARDELERRVDERTEALSASNDSLRRSQEALRASEERLAIALKAGNVGTWSWKVADDQFLLDDTSMQLLGLPPSFAAAGYAQLEAAIEPNQRAEVSRTLKAAMTSGDEFYSEFQAIGHDGTVRSLAMRGQAFGRRSGQRLVGVFWDITERKLQEEVLRQYAAELQRSNQELEEFGYIASHDLKEPLRMMASYAQLLSRRYGKSLDPQAATFIAYIVDGSIRMNRLLDDMLSYSRAGRIDQPREEVDTRALVERITKSLGAALADVPGSRVTFSALPVVAAHETPLHQVFQNLISNGLKFRRPDVPPHVHVAAQRWSGEWLFRISDNGIGIEPAQAERIFKIFQRLHSRERYEGTGIGLAVVKKIIERYGGRIWVDSRPNQGSSFCFTLPDSTEPVIEANAAAGEGAAAAAPRRVG